jgi:hypothetical protein
MVNPLARVRVLYGDSGTREERKKERKKRGAGAGNVRVNVTLRRVRETIIALEKQ